jgi:hypothetical protein
MIKFLLPVLLLSPLSVSATPETLYQLDDGAQEVINRYCAKQVDIPYGSDNFSDREWSQFQECQEELIEYVYD